MLMEWGCSCFLVCSEENDKITHTAHFINTLRNNDYPTSITRLLNNKKSRKLHRPFNTCFLQLPHFSEIITKEIHRSINKEGLDIQLAHPGSSLRQYLTKKNNNTITTCTQANCPIRYPNICQKTYTIYRLICLKCHNCYVGSTVRPLHIRIKEHLNTRASSSHKHLNEIDKDNWSHVYSAWRLNPPTWHHDYNTQHGVLTPHVTPCLQRSKNLWTSNIVFIYKKNVSDNKVCFF